MHWHEGIRTHSHIIFVDLVRATSGTEQAWFLRPVTFRPVSIEGDGQKLYTIQVYGNAEAGLNYLQTSGSGVTSLVDSPQTERAQWRFEVENGNQNSFFRIRPKENAHGLQSDKTYLSFSSGGVVNMQAADDGSGMQRWHLMAVPGLADVYYILVDNGPHEGQDCLSSTNGGYIGFYSLGSAPRQRWLLKEVLFSNTSIGVASYGSMLTTFVQTDSSSPTTSINQVGSATMSGGGSSLSNVLDSFFFLHTEVASNHFEIEFYSANGLNESIPSKFVLMVRESIIADSKYFGAAMSSNGGSRAQWRLGNNDGYGTSIQKFDESHRGGLWLKVVRLQNTFSAYCKINSGDSYQLMHILSLSMLETVQIGIGLSGDSTTTLEFSNFSYVKLDSSVVAPVTEVDFSAPDAETTYTFELLGDARIEENAPGGILKSLRIDSNNQKVKLGSGIDISPSSMKYCTLTIGIYLESIQNTGWVMSNENGNYDRGIMMHDTRLGGMGLGLGKAHSFWTTQTLPVIGKWIYIVGVFRQGANSYLYVDDIKAPNAAIGSNDSGTPDVYLGQGLNMTDHFANCWIKEAQVFNRALDDREVDSLYSSFQNRLTVRKACR